MGDNVILRKSFLFSVQIVKLFRTLRESGVERSLCSQVLRSGTSIGANVEEAMGGSSTKDFIHKLEIAYKEARETMYWLRLFNEAGIICGETASSYLNECGELLRILSSILITTKSKHRKPPS
jgi:four helix bundle protein